MFITIKKFNPDLHGKAVRLTGVLTDGYYIVTEIDGEEIEFIGAAMNSLRLHVRDFDSGGYTMRVLDNKVPELERKHRPGFKRAASSTRQIRTDQQVKIDIAAIETFLKQSGGVVRLSDILDHMLHNGRTHWNNNNASGFVKHAIRHGAKITQPSIGLYQYSGGVTT